MTDDKMLQKEIVNLGKAKDMDGLTEFLEKIVRNGMMPDFDRQAIKMAINISATMLDGPGEKRHILKRYIKAVEDILQVVPELGKLENIHFSRIRAYLAVCDLDSAVGIALNCSEPRLRLFSAILEECGKQHIPETAESILMAAFSRDLQPTDDDFAHVVRSWANETNETFVLKLKNVILLLQDHRECMSSKSLIDALFDSSIARDFNVWCDVDIPNERESTLCGVCPKTGIKLDREDLNEDEYEEMLDLTTRLSTEATKLRFGDDAPNEFGQVLKSLDFPIPTVILDAANIAHTNQNFEGGYFRFDQIESILSHFRAIGRKCLVVIHTKWLNPHRDLDLFFAKDGDSKVATKRKRKMPLPQLGETLVEGRPFETDDQKEEVQVLENQDQKHIVKHPVPVDLIERWRSNGELLEVPHGQNDDWYWMHVCLLAKKASSEEVILVSNDLMRDHLWRMKNPKFFSKFRANHLCQYTIRFGEDQINQFDFHMPNPFSVTIQSHELHGKTVFHVPYKQIDDQAMEKIRWLVIEV